jgi:hypothetical protein
VEGRKRWELRTTHCHKRGQVGIIAKGTGHIIGLVTIVASHGPLTPKQLADAEHLHFVPSPLLEAQARWLYAWELQEALGLASPVPYRHINGARSWVGVDHATALRVAIEAFGAVHGHVGCDEDDGSNQADRLLSAPMSHRQSLVSSP